MRPKLQIFADENIALVDDFFSFFGDVHTFCGLSLKPQDIETADVLLVRSVTPVNDYLLSNCRGLKFVGSATTGTDHVQKDLLAERNIHFSHAPGSNADSVVEYVLSAVASAHSEIRQISPKTVGIVGLGTIGSRVARVAQALGCSVIASDPPLEVTGTEIDPGIHFTSLIQLLQTSDIISLHVPLVVDGPHPTKDMIGSSEADYVRPGSLFINTSRGQTVTQEAIRELAERDVSMILDVWPSEPEPDPELVTLSSIATPHIAGYSFDGKIDGTRMLRDALRDFLTVDSVEIPEVVGLKVSQLEAQRTGETNGKDELLSAILEAYNIISDDASFREAYLTVERGRRAETFSRLRKTYPIRRSFSGYVFDPQKFDPTTSQFLIDVLGVRPAQ